MSDTTQENHANRPNGATDHPTASRQTGVGYIDEAEPTAAAGIPVHIKTDEDDVSNGSSVEEEEEEEVELSDSATWDGGATWVGTDELRDGAAGQDDLDSDGISGDEEWGVENEDWELAKGDFTKQYNRARQQRTAVDGSSGSTSRVPLPALNPHMPSKEAGPSRTQRRIINPSVFAAGVSVNPKSALDRHDKDKSDRATQEQVLDSRTRLVLQGLTKRSLIGQLEGCISTGKEANVYRALAGEEPPIQFAPYPPALAVKIYRTSILNFRSRSEYIVGEHRFKGEYTSAKNPRKMVRVWAEKELRNLRRLAQGGIRCPRVFDCKENVLVMEILSGEDGASPRLKDAALDIEQLRPLYLEMVIALRRLYRQCKLIHADLSEYNILYHDSHLYIIDVSQSVEQDHPRAFEFLRKDIHNVDEYFTKISLGEVKTLGLRRTWDFIMADTVGGLTSDEEVGDGSEERLSLVIEKLLEEEAIAMTSDSQHDSHRANDDAVFMSTFIPRNLGEIRDPEGHLERQQADEGVPMVAAKQMEVDQKAESAEHTVYQPPKSVRFQDDEEEETEQDESETDESEGEQKKPRGFKHEDKESKKERKKAVKDAQRERRKNKMPKAEKQKLMKQKYASHTR